MKILPISILVLSTVILLPTVNSKNILYLAWPAYSHLNSMISIANELAKYGHNNYFILDRNYTKTFQNQQSINILPMDEIPEMELMRFDAQKQEKSKQIYVMRQLLNTFPMICDRFLRNEKWIESLRAVDASLAVINGIFMTNCLTIIPYQLSIPFVLTASEIYPSLHRIPWLPTVFPNSMLTSSDKMTYSEKLISTLAAILDYTIPPIGAPTHSVKTYAKDKPDISFTDLLHQAQFFLIEKDVLLDYPLPQLPNVRYVGGLAAKRSVSLKGELLKFVNASTNGIVLVSFGSIIDDFPAVQLEKLQSAFKQIKYDVVWRQKKTFSHKNIYISDWVPQNDLLGHPKTKLFVTHCGNSGQFEALFHGVPMLGIPLFADQHYNSRRMTEKSYGLSLDIENFTPEELIEKINELIDNKTYSEKIKRASEIFHSRPEYPAKKSARHIDHILKYGGEYLKSPCQESRLYEFFMIDVLTPIFAVTLFLIYLIYLSVKKCLSFCCKKKTKTD